MLKTNYLQLNILIVLCTFQVLCDSKSIRDTATDQKLTRIIVDETTIDENKRAIQNCDQLPQIVLAELLGEAYNSRYMSINWPINTDDNHENARNSYSVMKRKVENIPSFYVEETHTTELSEKPAWDVKGYTDELQSVKQRRRKRAAIAEIENSMKSANIKLDDEETRTEITNVDVEESTATFNDTVDDETFARIKRAYGRSGSSAAGQNDNKRLYPWKCDAKIKWVDLGPDYFPRFLRTVECTKHYCWYKAFVCKPKSFAVKILHRRKGMCADAENLRKISSFDFRGEFGELWKWEEVAINFCCDCAVA